MRCTYIVTLLFIAGTRPEMIKLFPIIAAQAIRSYNYEFIWSDQYYDYEMPCVFFEEFGGLEQDYDLGVGSGSHCVQTSRIIQGIEGKFSSALGKKVEKDKLLIYGSIRILGNQ